MGSRTELQETKGCACRDPGRLHQRSSLARRKPLCHRSRAQSSEAQGSQNKKDEMDMMGRYTVCVYIHTYTSWSMDVKPLLAYSFHSRLLGVLTEGSWSTENLGKGGSPELSQAATVPRLVFRRTTVDDLYVRLQCIVASAYLLLLRRCLWNAHVGPLFSQSDELQLSTAATSR